MGIMGRPQKPKAQQRTNILRIRLTSKERSALDSAAKSDFLETSTWARRVLLGVAIKKLTPQS